MSKTPEQLGREWKTALFELQSEGWISGLTEIGERSFAANTMQGWAVVAMLLSEKGLGGQLIPGKGVGWRYGKYRGGTLMQYDRKTLADVLGGYHKGEYVKGVRDILKEVVKGTDLEHKVSDCWSVGNAARNILATVGKPDYYQKPARSKKDPAQFGHMETLFSDERFRGYHDCEPGIYENVTLWDIKSCYATLLTRASTEKKFSLRPRLDEYGLYWKKNKPGERERFLDAIGACWEHPTLRNSLFGVSLGSYKPVYYYSKNKETGETERGFFVIGAGQYRPLALLVLRSMSELCHEQSLLCLSKYTTIDSVAIVGDSIPALWRDHGLTVERKFTGNAEFRGRGNWAFWYGNSPKPVDLESSEWLHKTKPYIKQGIATKQTGTMPRGKPGRPEKPIYTQWL